MNYQQTLDFLYEQLPMYQHSGKSAFKENIGNIVALTQALDNPHKKFKSIHVAGTNGKGSSSHILAAILQAAGYKTGLYTSPHLKEFTERIRVNGTQINREEVVRFVEENQKLIKEVQPSFFEMTVAMAFQYFAKQEVDIAIIEVGLGGRLDSTNIITPEISLITNIGLDHQNILGNSIELIAMEKAGIIKKEVPVVIGEKQDSLIHLFTQHAHSMSAPLYFANDTYKVIRLNSVSTDADYAVLGSIFGSFELDLLGHYQLNNLPGVFKTVELIKEKGFDIPNSAIRKGLKHVGSSTGLKGRWQILQKHPLIICDTGHNADGIGNIVEQLKQQEYKNLFIVLGTVNDKDLESILCLLPKEAFYLFCKPLIARGLDAEVLEKKAAVYELKGQVIADVNMAVEKAKKLATHDDLVFIGGSTFVVAELNDL